VHSGSVHPTLQVFLLLEKKVAKILTWKNYDFQLMLRIFHGKKKWSQICQISRGIFFPKSPDFYDKFQLLVKNIERPWFYYFKKFG